MHGIIGLEYNILCREKNTLDNSFSTYKIFLQDQLYVLLCRDEEFDEEKLTDLLSRIVEISREMVRVANRAAEACTKRHPKQVYKISTVLK